MTQDEKRAIVHGAIVEARLNVAAFMLLRLNPGCDYNRWASLLVEKHCTDLMDVFNRHCAPEELLDGIRDMWDAHYYDYDSGLEYSYKTWAAAFATEESVQMYYDMIERRRL